MFATMLYLIFMFSLVTVTIKSENSTTSDTSAAKNTSEWESPKCGEAVPLGYIDCFFTKTNNVIPLVNETELAVTNNSIFFLVMTCGDSLTYKQACSVESAAKANKHRQIVVFFVGPVSESCYGSWPISVLRMWYKNIKLYRLDMTTFVNETVMSDYFSSGQFDNSQYPVQHTSDILRLIILRKFGGILLDLHLIVTKPLDGLGENWLAKVHSNTDLHYAVMALTKNEFGKSFTDALMRLYKLNYQRDSSKFYVASVFHRLITKICKTRKVEKMNACVCNGLTFHESDIFFPISEENYTKFSEKYNLEYSMNEDAYAYYIWDRISPGNPLFTDDTLYEALMIMFCPYMYSSIPMQ